MAFTTQANLKKVQVDTTNQENYYVFQQCF